MRTALDKKLRGKLEKTVEKAREIVEVAVTEALIRLGISDGNAPSYLSETERKLRNRLRAHGRQLGDVLHKETTSLVKANDQETELLINEMAYEHWHRMLFARFLEQSDLLMYDQNTHVSIEECFELAEEDDPLGEGLTNGVAEKMDGWQLAGRLAQKMLPQIFRADSPVFEVKLSINHVNTLEELIAKLHLDTFQASDSLGWCYQFWQNKKKKQVNESGVKIGAKELSPVTQLFTEPYMVSFLLDNALGAWWAKRRLTKDDLQTAASEQELRELAAIPGVPLEYLRFVQDEESKVWSSAAGDFEQWPEQLSELKTLDPCCGSGHFLVAKLLMLVPMRMELEALTAKQAIDKVLAENIHGLELDQRCVELAAFALALEAWRYPGSGGYRQLPELQLACSGLSINEAQKEWKDLAKGDEELQGAIKWMQQTFKDAPTLGSLIDPTKALTGGKPAPWEQLQRAMLDRSEASIESSAVAQGLSKAAALLTDKYQWVVTNVPYLGDINQGAILKSFIEEHYSLGKKDLANAFSIRCFDMLAEEGASSLVLPQNWLFLKTYQKFRESFLRKSGFSMIARLGSGAFDTISGEVVKAILWSFYKQYTDENDFVAIDVSEDKGVGRKSEALVTNPTISLEQYAQLENPRASIILTKQDNRQELLSKYCIPYYGSKPGQTDRVRRNFWELNELNSKWMFLESTPKKRIEISGKSNICYSLDSMKSEGIIEFGIRGASAWGHKGIIASRTSKLKAVDYLGKVFDDNCYSLVPKEIGDLAAINLFVTSELYNLEVRKINQKLAVDTQSMVNIPFDIHFWRNEASKTYPNDLPKPYSNDPTQWLFHGHPCKSVIWNEDTKTTAIGDLRKDDTVLQVAVARLLGYRWPAELDTEMELAPEMREVLAKCKDFAGLVDDDGIVCIPAIRGEKPAVDRLEAILHSAYGDEFSATVLNNLLTTVKSRDLNLWLRDKFFEQHSKLFQHRPFIWQIWDGLPDGFSALINYHKLDYKGLERLIYTYLDDWISTQIQLEKDGEEGAELRLTAASNLKKLLESILEGEEGLDIFIRWKTIEEQAIGWHPDLNDGVRLNIRPFMKITDVGKKGAGVLRSKPSIQWKKDGFSQEPSPWFDLGLKYGGKQGDRINDHHLSIEEKREAKIQFKKEN